MICGRSKPGWICRRERGHEGPCAAVPVGFWHRLYWRIRLRMWDLGDVPVKEPEDDNMYPKKLDELNRDNYGQPLVCSGCAHSSASAEFPGMPSGERPCCFCTRNVQRVQWVERMPEEMRKNYGKTFTAYYDNSPMKKCPMDCYHSTDRLTNGVPEGSHIIT